MPIILALIAAALGATTGSLPFGVACGLVVGLILLRREYSNQIASLRQELDFLKRRVSESSNKQPSSSSAKQDIPQELVKEDVAQVELSPVAEPVVTSSVEYKNPWNVQSQSQPVEGFGLPTSAQSNQAASGPSVADQAFSKIKTVVWSYFTDGNVFVRIGLLVLFFGVAFLLRYAAENSMIPMQLRYIGAAVVGLVLLLMGWRLRNTKRIYALLLQGGGIGVIYITIFAAYQLANLLPSGLAFALLVLFAVFTALLAVWQDARGLAMFATIGGFIAPFLASSGSGNYIGLFSYYALLNASLLTIAWHKSWRMLNLLGFGFTFLVYGSWYVFEYQPSMRFAASCFLLLFFVMYSLLGVLYALKQEHNFKGIVDGTLVFGTPLFASSILMAMFRDYNYGIALTAAALGAYYVLISRFLWKRSGEPLRLMAEAMLAIGVVFATLAIPYALDGHWTSATWALEAAGILWVSIRQNRHYAQWFAVAIQIGAGVFFLFANSDDIGSRAWINPAFMGGVFIALGSLVSAKLLFDATAGHKLRFLHYVFFVWGMGWWLLSAGVQIDRYIEHAFEVWLVLVSATVVALLLLNDKWSWGWKPALQTAALLLPTLTCLAWASSLDNRFILAGPAALLWPLALAINYWAIVKLENEGWNTRLISMLHTGLLVLTALILSHDGVALLQYKLPALGTAYRAIVVVPLLGLIYLAKNSLLPAVQRLGDPLRAAITASALILLTCWSLLSNLSETGSTNPLPYLPFLNVLDLANIAVFVAAGLSLPLFKRVVGEQANVIYIAMGLLVFVWLSAVLLRSIHHFTGLPFDLNLMAGNAQVQTSLSILWTAIGMAAMLFASKKSLRPLWIAAAGLIGVVLVKMFFIDLDASGTVERIVSFMVVGGMLVALGYFSPIPDSDDEPAEEQNKAEPEASTNANANVNANANPGDTTSDSAVDRQN
ncbi:MAG: DUF2339 domain-containing protein [Pseudomonadales bacterium]